MTRLHRSAMGVLIEDITKGRVHEGDWLPREVDLATRFDTSRSVARETIRALEERGVVKVRHGRGAQVLPIAEWDLLDEEILDALLRSGHGDEVVDEGLACRRLLEGEAAALAARRVQPNGARRLTEAFARVRAADPDDRDELGRATAEFRRVLARLSGNRPLGRMLAPMEALNSTALRELAAKQLPGVVARCERILEAVCAGDADAARAAVEADVDATSAALASR